MKKICFLEHVSIAMLSEMFDTIMKYIRGEMFNAVIQRLKGENPTTTNGIICMTERMRQYYTWGAKQFKYVTSVDGSYGIQFNVSGLLHKGRVRIYYNPSSDYFDVELLKARKDELVWGCEDIDCVELHNILHQHIERTDDVEVY